MQNFFFISKYKKNSLINRAENHVISKLGITYILLAAMGIFSHVFYWFFWTYVKPQTYEIPWIRITGIITCSFILTYKYWPLFLKRLFPLFWFLTLLFNLSFFFTVYLFATNFGTFWLASYISMIFTSIMLIPNYFLLFTNLIIGVGLGLLYCYIIIPETLHFDPDLIIFGLIPALMFAFTAGIAFSYSNSKGIAAQERARIFKSFAGSIAHELRNPLGMINLIGIQIKNLLLDSINKDNKIEEHNKAELLNLTYSIADFVASANQIINMILADLNEKPVTSNDFDYLEADKTLLEITRKFGYNSEEQKQKVKLDITSNNNFTFKAVPDRLTFIIYNLLKNALYYLKDYPDSIVTIGAESRVIDDKEWNIIYVYDTGPGVPPHLTSRLFDDFFTSGKKEGTGLGLAFCRRNMRIFKGDIICESKFGENGESGWTKFSLLFPKLSAEEINKSPIHDTRKTILLVDDQETNLIVVKSKIENFLPNVVCHMARDGMEAIKMAKENKYHLILMDIQMPEFNGINTTKEIREFDRAIPIIAFTSLDKDLFLKETGSNSISESDFNYYLSKPSVDNVLYRTISKWMVGTKDEFLYLGEKNKYLKALKGKKIILADDQKVMRTMIRKILERSEMTVVEASNGKELLEIYKNNLDKNNKSSFDIIITDINMPPHNGDEAAKEIRRIENSNKISSQDEIPIIALSGDGKKEDIYYFLKCQITDYFIKGDNGELLLKMIAHYSEVEADNKLDDNKKDNLETHNKSLENSSSEFQTLNHNILTQFDQADQAEILNGFLESSKKIMNNIKKGAEKNNIAELLIQTHAIKGSSGTIGAEKLFNHIKIVESMMKSGYLSDGWLIQLETIYDELVKEIEEYL